MNLKINSSLSHFDSVGQFFEMFLLSDLITDDDFVRLLRFKYRKKYIVLQGSVPLNIMDYYFLRGWQVATNLTKCIQLQR